MTAPAAIAPGARDVLAQLVAPTLHAQRWSLEGAQAGAMSRAVHLASGRGLLGHGGGELPLRAGDIVWLPAGSARSLRVDAGSVGVTVGVSDALLAAAMGEQADAAPLRQVSARMVAVSAPEPGPRDELVRSLHAIEAEARRGAGGSRPYLAAHLTLVLVTLWRLTSRDGAEPVPGARGAQGPRGHQRLLRFRHLVEAQFRQHWPVARYAAELALSADRLHELCVGTLGRPPLALVHQRLVREACSLLAGTDLAVERLAADLGFGSASHFSRFFRRWMGTPPSAWRAQVRAQAAAGRPVGPASYADWP
jgi:AraC family transcriptional regulator, transcriptional activator of pobA